MIWVAIPLLVNAAAVYVIIKLRAQSGKSLANGQQSPPASEPSSPGQARGQKELGQFALGNAALLLLSGIVGLLFGFARIYSVIRAQVQPENEAINQAFADALHSLLFGVALFALPTLVSSWLYVRSLRHPAPQPPRSRRTAEVAQSGADAATQWFG